MISDPMGQGNGIEIEAAGLRDMIAADADIQLIDVREPWEVDICRISDSRSIPLGDLQQRASELSTDKTMVMICHHGTRSYRATMWLRQNGFDKALNLAGGIDAWAREIEPGMPRY
ncbi:rhodanese-like domain-containing protein [Dongia rigui]|uniref:Rhodanese-like domain-containing protein n=1 Tax=Dongia rigui TaxID=940149 RepID=A0ABU5E3W3_9PROT|nr:rhodanese-like domain-containing protein [Dongia rigui]MDY0874179.1 rhodanese-like domain-containing protein [Dongia rigui]